MNNVILKLSGEVLKGRQDSGIDYDKLLVFAKELHLLINFIWPLCKPSNSPIVAIILSSSIKLSLT